MAHKPWKLLLSSWATSLAFAVALFTFAATSAQEILQPYAPPILHTFLDSANVYPESVTVDQSSGTFYVGSVKEGTIYKGKIARPSLEVFSPGGADGRSIATGMFFANDRLVVVGRQTGLIFIYNTKNGRRTPHGTPVKYVNAPGAAGINVNGIVVIAADLDSWTRKNRMRGKLCGVA